MVTTDELFEAILAMDSYNRGYNAGLDLPSGMIGNAEIYSDSTKALGLTQTQAVGFFAESYKLSDTQIVISYRGTDNLFGLTYPTGADLLNGYGVGAGSPSGAQATMSVEFYQAVQTKAVQDAIQNGTSTTIDIGLVGHSLGGGLAGYVGALFGSKGWLFDNMNFQNAAGRAYLDAMAAFYGTPAPNTSEDQSEPGRLLSLIYGNQTPWANNVGSLKAWNTAGEFLSNIRNFPSTEMDPGPGIDLPGLDNGFTGGNLHSMSLLVLLMYADNQSVASDWKQASKYFIPELFDDAIAQAVDVSAYKPADTTTSYSDVLRDAIAYSAISSGTFVFGDTGIAALFNDAVDLGKAVEAAGASSTLTESSDNLSDSLADGLAAVMTQFAGQLAIGKVANNSDVLAGVLSLSNDRQTLAVDFSDQLWSKGRSQGTAPTTIVGRDDILNDTIRDAEGNPLATDVRAGMKWLWGTSDSSVFDRFVIATTNGAINSTLTARSSSSSKATLFDASDADDVITGSDDNEFISGEDGNDTIKGGAGDDLLAGGKGDDRLSGGGGKNFLLGGAGNDTELFDGSGVKLTAEEVDDASGLKLLQLTDANGAVDRSTSIENVDLTSSDDWLSVSDNINKLSDRVTFDGGGQSKEDVLDFSNFDSLVKLKRDDDSTVLSRGLFSDLFSGPAATFKNFERIILTSQNDTATASDDVSVIDGGSGNDVLIGGPKTYTTLLGGDGNDQLFAGAAGSTLDGGVSNGDGDDYVGAEGADTFVIGNGVHAQQGTDAIFKISNAGPNDRLVVRLSDTLGVFDASAWTKGIVLSGGVRPLVWAFDGTTIDPRPKDPNEVEAYFSTSIINPTIESVPSSYSSAEVSSRDLQGVRPEVGNLFAAFHWDKLASTLDIDISTSYGDFSVHVDGYQNGQLGLNFVEANEPLSSLTIFPSRGDAYTKIEDAWNQYNGAMTALVQATQIVALPDPGDKPNVANPIAAQQPQLGPNEWDGSYLPIYNGDFTPEDGAVFDPSSSGAIKAPFAQSGQNPLKKDPLVLDLSGNGIHLTDLNYSNTYVDFGGTGTATRTGWVDSDVGILVNQASGSNAIIGVDGNGFAQLAALDSNSDGQVNSADPGFASLRVWVDEDGDGTIGADELLTLNQAGITSLATQHTSNATPMNGNTISGVGSFTRADGSVGDIDEVELQTDPAMTKINPPDGFQVSAAASLLPPLKGYGHVVDLWVAMTESDSLRSEAAQFVLVSKNMTGSQFDSGFEHLIQDWAGVANIDSASRGPLIDAKHLAVVEAFYGQTFQQVNGSGVTLDSYNAATIERAYRSIVDTMKVRFVAQLPSSALALGASPQDVAANPLSVIAGAIHWDANDDSISTDFNDVIQRIAMGAPSDTAARSAYIDYMARVVRALRVDVFNDDQTALAQGIATAGLNSTLPPGLVAQLQLEAQSTSIIDGRAGGLNVLGTINADTILASSKDQVLNGVSGSTGLDAFVYESNDGNDQILEASGQSLLLLSDLHPSDVSFERVDQDVVLKILPTGKQIVLDHQLNGQGINEIGFNDQTLLTRDQIASAATQAAAGTDITLGVGDRNVSGESLAHAYIYSSTSGGNDRINGQIDGSKLKLADVISTDVVLTHPLGSKDVVVKINATGKRVTLANELNSSNLGASIQFADGVTWNVADIQNILASEAPPTDESLWGATVAEYATNGTVIGTVFGSDPRSDSKLSFSFVDDAGGRFAINNPLSGVVTVNNSGLIDGNGGQPYSVTVRVTNQFDLSYDETFKIVTTPAALTNSSDGTSTVTINDTDGKFSWSSFATHYSGASGTGSILDQTGINDSGSVWQNVFDVANSNSWKWYTSVTTSAGQPIDVSGERDDGTHWLTAYDAVQKYSWSTYTMNFDANWNYQSITGTNDDGSTTLDMGQVWASYDTLRWYAKPYVVSLNPTPSSNSNVALPVVLDLDGNGIDIRQLSQSSAYFDMDGSGSRNHTAWVSGNDGILAIDLGEGGAPGPDGVIDQSKEIEFSDWAPGSSSDMASLRQVFDTNHDGALDTNDMRWDDFRIWQDANGDGVSQPGEVHKLSDFGISSINLVPSGSPQVLADGSMIQGLATFIRTDGTTGVAGDIGLAFDPASQSLVQASQLAQFVQAMTSYSADTKSASISNYTPSQEPNIIGTSIATQWKNAAASL